jgi:hypothetical protein
MRGTVTQGDLASWILAGSYTRHTPAVHAYEAGVSYGMQRYLGGNGDALAAMRDGSRIVGSMYAFDSWQIVRPIRVSYGAKYSRYDYLTTPGLWSPRASVAVQPLASDSMTVRASMSRRQVAPGAEEFLPSAIGLWLPPERTFAPVAHGMFRPERHDQMEFGVERTWPGEVVVGLRVFDQRVDNQLVTVFGVGLADIPSESGAGHYEVGSAGGYDARGWGVTVSRAVSDRLRATVDYSQADAVWHRRSPDFDALAALERSVLRSEDRVHDLTASVESVVARTATRVFMIYKLNAALAAADDSVPSLATARTRFDVQVNQSLPFLNFTNAQWEMLVAVSNLFKEELGETSIYDEALVVRPPKRVLGGVTVKF